MLFIQSEEIGVVLKSNFVGGLFDGESLAEQVVKGMDPAMSIMAEGL